MGVKAGRDRFGGDILKLPSGLFVRLGFFKLLPQSVGRVGHLVPLTSLPGWGFHVPGCCRHMPESGRDQTERAPLV